ncbi:MAG: hypothetical protein RL226_1519, partial [Bacteroidota bacterium]
SNIIVHFVPEIAGEPVNVWIDSVWFDTPVRLLNQPEVLRLRLKSNTTAPLENIPMTLTINGSGKTVGSFSMTPELHTDTALFFTNTEGGFIDGTVSIRDNPVVYDDEWHFGYRVAGKINVLCINGVASGKAFESMFANDPFYAFTQVDSRQVDYSSIATYDFVIINEVGAISGGLKDAIQTLTGNGGSALVVPARTSDINTYNELFDALAIPRMGAWTEAEMKVGDLNLQHELYQDIFEKMPANLDLPGAKGYFTFAAGSRSTDEHLLTFLSGSPFIFGVKPGEGRAYVMAAPLADEWSNFAQHALFVPSVLRMAEFSKTSGVSSITIGSGDVLSIKGAAPEADQTFVMRNISNGREFIPSHRPVFGHVEVFVENKEAEAGNYHLMLGDSVVAAVGLNYNRKESDLAAYDPGEWETILTDFGWKNTSVIEADMDNVSATVANIESGKLLWDRFIWVALFALLAELLLIKLWKS